MRSSFRFALLGLTIIILLGVVFVGGVGSGYLAGVYLRRDGSAALPTAGSSAEPSPQAPVMPDQPTAMPTPVPPATMAADDQGAFQLFWEVLALVREHYYGEMPDMRTITYGAIRGMLSSLGDDYTAFIEPDFAAVLSEDASGEFQGIGAFVGLGEHGWLEIVRPFDGGPADVAGLRSGDLVAEVDGVSLEGKTLYEGINLIRGPAGTQVSLLVAREGEAELFEVVVIRDRIEIPITEVVMREDGIGYLRLTEFSTTAAGLVEDGLKDLLRQEPRGIILDLRQNPGGWLDQSVEVADLFLDEGLVLIERWSNGAEQRFSSDTGDLGEAVPLVVLVDGGTASASEIVAGALQDRGRAVLIGETTYGKGSVQRPFPLGDGSELRVTIARWFTPDDRAINGSGLEPDIAIPWPAEPAATEDDPQLERAAEYLLSGN